GGIFLRADEARDADAALALQIERLGRRDDRDVIAAVDVRQIRERRVVEIDEAREEAPVPRLRRERAKPAAQLVAVARLDVTQDDLLAARERMLLAEFGPRVHQRNWSDAVMSSCKIPSSSAACPASGTMRSVASGHA